MYKKVCIAGAAVFLYLICLFSQYETRVARGKYVCQSTAARESLVSDHLQLSKSSFAMYAWG